MDEDVPLFPTAAIGYRVWRLNWKGQLLPTYKRRPWKPGLDRATCLAPINPCSSSPGLRCHCGFNAAHDLEYLEIEHGSLVFGAIAGQGDLRVHHSGFRAAEARVIGLWMPRRYLRRRLLAEIAGRRYGIPVFEDPESLREWASRFGSPVPESVRPERSISEMDYLRFSEENEALAWIGLGLLALATAPLLKLAQLRRRRRRAQVV